MKVIQINSVYGYGSTGKIVKAIHQNNLENGIDSYVIYGRTSAYGHQKRQAIIDNRVFYFNDLVGQDLHVLKALIFDKHGLYSVNNTKKILRKIDEIQPDIIHLHNIHGFYINYEMLFKYIRQHHIKVVWTLHDCWSFTGYCSHYEFNGCNEWKSGCKTCKFKNVYPYRILSNSANNYVRKMKSFDYENIVFVTPSNWLKKQLSESFLKSHTCFVIHNNVDVTHFKYNLNNNLRSLYGIGDRKVLLGVASPFSKQKGFDEFIKLSKLVNDSYRIVLIGVNKKQQKNLPSNVIGILRTDSQDELAQWYSLADYFLNLTLEDTYPTVNLEAMACGTPVITYRTGGSTEIVEGYGTVVDQYDLKGLMVAIEKDTEDRKQLIFDNDMCGDYLKLYRQIVN